MWVFFCVCFFLKRSTIFHIKKNNFVAILYKLSHFVTHISFLCSTFQWILISHCYRLLNSGRKAQLSEKVMKQVKSHKRKLNGLRRCCKLCCRGICHACSLSGHLCMLYTSKRFWKEHPKHIKDGLKTSCTLESSHCVMFYWNWLKLSPLRSRKQRKQAALSDPEYQIPVHNCEMVLEGWLRKYL